MAPLGAGTGADNHDRGWVDSVHTPEPSGRNSYRLNNAGCGSHRLGNDRDGGVNHWMPSRGPSGIWPFLIHRS